MRVCLLTDRPDHPVPAALPGLMGRWHTVELLSPESDATFLSGLSDPAVFADLYLLEASTRESLALARLLQRRGGRVLNEPAAAELCQDRMRIAESARGAGLPFAPVADFARLSGFVAYADFLAATNGFTFPVVVKSRRNRRGDLVAKPRDLTALRALAERWADEPVVVQRFAAHDGWEHKLLVIGAEVFGGLRRTARDSGRSATVRPLAPKELPSELRELAGRVGATVGLQVYEVELVVAGRGPVIVDINAFPWGRDPPWAREALVAAVRTLGAESGGASGVRDHRDRRTPVPVKAVHTAVHRLTTTTLDGDGDGGGDAALAPQACRLRLKAGRGLVGTYRLIPEEPRQECRRSRAQARGRLVTVRLSERLLATERLPELLASVEPGELAGFDGMTVQTFPADDGLPGLPGALSVDLDGRLADELCWACRLVTGEPGIRVTEIRAIPQRYKPGSRCVVRYEVTVTAPPRGDRRGLVFFGKVFPRTGDAVAAHRLARRLWCVRPVTTRARVARPVGLVEELGLALTEVAGGAHDRIRIPGEAMLRPGKERGDRVGGPAIPEAALRAVAEALSWLHTADVAECLPESPVGVTYLARAREWAASIGRQIPRLATELDRVFRRAEGTFPRVPSDRVVPIHGTFKPSQLVFCSPGRVVMTDFDSACLGDPALDLGYFLAYLRPAGLWRGRQRSRLWFSSARRVFLDAYRRAARERGAGRPDTEIIAHRAGLFEALVILKVVSRRARHLNSPRPGELEVAVAEIDACLERLHVDRGMPE